MKASIMVIFLAFTLCQLLVAFKHADIGRMTKRNAENPDWNALGWAWGKRSSDEEGGLPRRYIRALQAVKKNPDWQDLGWTWGRK